MDVDSSQRVAQRDARTPVSAFRPSLRNAPAVFKGVASYNDKHVWHSPRAKEIGTMWVDGGVHGTMLDGSHKLDKVDHVDINDFILEFLWKAT